MLVELVLTGAAFALLSRTLHVAAATWWAASWLAAAGATFTLSGVGGAAGLGCWPASILVLAAAVSYVGGAATVMGRPVPRLLLASASAAWLLSTLVTSLGGGVVGSAMSGLVHLTLQATVALWCMKAPRHEGGGVLRLLGGMAVAVGVLYFFLSPCSFEGRHLLSEPVALPAIFGVSLALAFVQMVAVTGFYHRRAKLRDQAMREKSIAMVERERSIIAQELHDGACQVLMASKLHLEHAVEHSVPAATYASLRSALSCIAGVIEDLRDISHSLYPSGLAVLGFEGAVGELVKGTESESRRASLFCDLQGPPLPPAVELALYRIIQEALHNVAQHSNATEVRVSVVARDGCVRATVEDNGVGFDAGDVFAGMGLASMRERAEVLGGSLEIEARVGGGVAVRVVLPRP